MTQAEALTLEEVINIAEELSRIESQGMQPSEREKDLRNILSEWIEQNRPNHDVIKAVLERHKPEAADHILYDIISRMLGITETAQNAQIEVELLEGLEN